MCLSRVNRTTVTSDLSYWITGVYLSGLLCRNFVRFVLASHSLETWGQYNEKSRTAYRPMALAKLILAQRARSAIDRREQGFYVANPAKLPWSGWVTMPASALRGDFHSLEDPTHGIEIPLAFEHGYSSFGRQAGPEELTFENTAQTFPDHAPNQVVHLNNPAVSWPWCSIIRGLPILWLTATVCWNSNLTLPGNRPHKPTWILPRLPTQCSRSPRS